MAGEQADERAGEAMKGGLSGGEWWRVDGPWRVMGTPEPGSAEDGDGVYLAAPPAGPPVPPPPTEPPAARRPARGAPAPAGPEVPVPRASRSFFRRSTEAEPEQPAEAEESGTPAAWLIAPAAPGSLRPPTTADFPGWDSVVIEFPPDDTEPAEPRRLPEQRGEAGAQPADAEPDPATGQLPGQLVLPKGSLLAGRRPRRCCCWRRRC